MSRKRKKKTLAELLEEALVPEEEQPYQVPENWVWVRLGKCINKLQYGYTQSATSKPVGPKFLRITDIQNGTVDWSTVPFCEISDLDFIKYKLYPNDIVVARTGATTGKSYLIENPENAVFASYLIRLSPSHILESRYLWLFMKSNCYWRQITTVSKGIAQPGVNATVLGNLAIPLPPLPEQKRIIARVESLLGKINEAKELIKEAKETFESRRSAILAKAFRGELTKKWREQHPDIEPADLLLAQGEEDSLEETKKSSKQKIAPPPANFPYELPKGWRWVKFGSCVENHNGKRVPVSGKERENRKGPFPYYGASGVIDSIDGYTHDGEFVLIGEDGANLISRNKPIAFLAKGKIWVNNHAHVVSCRIGILNDYLCHYINSIDLRPYVTGSAQPKLTKKMLNTIPIPLPSKEEQQEIVSLINNVFEAEKLVEENLSSLKSQLNSLTQSILNKAFRGELGTNDPEEESALELLKEVLLEQAGETIDNPKSKANRQGSLLLV